jgi:hypothetical protein
LHHIPTLIHCSGRLGSIWTKGEGRHHNPLRCGEAGMPRFDFCMAQRLLEPWTVQRTQGYRSPGPEHGKSGKA